MEKLNDIFFNKVFLNYLTEIIDIRLYYSLWYVKIGILIVFLFILLMGFGIEYEKYR